MYLDIIPNFGLPDVIFLEGEYDQLFDLICASSRPTPGIALLWQELQRAQRVRNGDAPVDVVRLGSLVSYTDLTSGRCQAAQLVAPDANAERARISVTTTSGAALIGLRPGDSFSWSLPGGVSGALRIESVTVDPRRELGLARARTAAHRRLVRELLSLS